VSPRLTPQPHVPPVPADCGCALVWAVIALTPLNPAALARVSPLPDRAHPSARRRPSARSAVTTYRSPF
jgi:hypothetical protein